MKVTYAPDGAEPKVWTGVKKGRLMSPEAEAIERHTGMTLGQVFEALTDESMLALHGLLFVLLKRTIPTLKWDELVFCQDDVDLDVEADEKAEVRDALRAQLAKGQTLAAHEQLYLEEIEAELAAADDEVAEDPKAPAS